MCSLNTFSEVTWGPSAGQPLSRGGVDVRAANTDVFLLDEGASSLLPWQTGRPQPAPGPLRNAPGLLDVLTSEPQTQDEAESKPRRQSKSLGRPDPGAVPHGEAGLVCPFEVEINVALADLTQDAVMWWSTGAWDKREAAPVSWAPTPSWADFVSLPHALSASFHLCVSAPCSQLGTGDAQEGFAELSGWC